MARRDGDDAALGQRIAQNIQALLRANHLTQGQLAYKAGVPQSGISALVIGRRNPSLSSIYKISQAFGVSIEELAGFKPLQIPEMIEEPGEQDRLERLEKQVAVLADLPGQVAVLADLPGQVANMANALAELLEQRSSARTPQRRGGAGRKSA